MIFKIQTYDSKSIGDSIRVKISVKPFVLSVIEVSPSSNSFNRTGGICGLWDNNSNRELYVIDDNGIEIFKNEEDLASMFWK